MLQRGGRKLPSTRRALFVLPLWTACLIWMWVWWINPERVGFSWLFIPLTLALLYEFALLPSIFLYFLLRIKYPAKRIAPKNKKVAVISLCVPAKESLDIIERQLAAMANITYPHDSWILDEGNNKLVKDLAKKYKVKHFSRKGLAKYNQIDAPFKAKTKAGNVNAWLDHVKRRKYEYFVQFDIDHLAKPEYLHKTLGHFRDPKVAWVQAPSVYTNHQFWTSRGSSEQELVLQGPLQMGFYGYSQTPFIIGSHCTYRTSAIREIDGFQPTRAEDHLDTVMLASKGYRGVFIPEIIAEGDGPETLNTYLGQQFAWAYSMFQVLMSYTPKLLKSMPTRQKLQFLFAQTWYPLWSIAYLVTFSVPIASLVLGQEVAHMQGNDFAIHFVPLFACSFLVWWAARPVMQPAKLMLSWRGMLLHVVRWPIVLKAVLAAAFRVKKPYMITPKGKDGKLPVVATYRPFLLLGMTSALAIIYASQKYHEHAIESQMVFALTNALFMLSICLTDLNISLRKAAIKLRNFNKDWIKPVMAAGCLAILLATAFVSSPLITDHAVAALTRSTTQADVQASSSLDTLKSELRLLPPKESPLPPIGVYSPNYEIATDRPYIRHAFVDWRETQNLAKQVLTAQKNGNTPLITVEPLGETDGTKLLRDIASGVHDAELQEISDVLAASNQPVYIRFAHEMDLSDLYTWSGQDPVLYIAAYRHVVEFSKTHGAKNVRWVWSPAGNIGAEGYYPGDDVVDIIGTTVLYDKYFYPTFTPTFESVIESRMLLQKIGKPVIIAELGVGNSDRTFQNNFLQYALEHYQQYGFQALVYLNSSDANIPGPDYHLTTLQAFEGRLYTKKETPAPVNEESAVLLRSALQPSENILSSSKK